MTKPWFLNLVLVAAVVVTGVRLIGTFGEAPVPLPSPAEPSRDLSLPAPPAAVPAGESYDAIVDKNLFSPDRGRPAPVQEVPVETDIPKSLPAPKATLFGVVVDPQGRKFAFLTNDAKGGGERPKKYGEGDTFSGGKVKEIRPDRVVLAVGASEYTVALRTPKEGIRLPAPPAPVATPAMPQVPVQRRIRRPVPAESVDAGSPGPGPVPRRRIRQPLPSRMRPGDYRDYPDDLEGTSPFPGDQDDQYWDEEGESPGQDDYPEYEDRGEW